VAEVRRQRRVLHSVCDVYNVYVAVVRLQCGTEMHTLRGSAGTQFPEDVLNRIDDEM
jgi:hypothetical protein